MEMVTLNDGNKIPAVGLGVFLIPNDGATYEAVTRALKAGYRHIDTAAAYFNEAEVGKAVKDRGIPREEIFITSKLWLQDYGYEAAKKGLETSLEKLGLDYVDLYLLHQPYGDVAGAWKALEEAKAEGKIRSIGVSNMTPKIWKEFVPQFAMMPAVNQVECNPFFQQRELRAFAQEAKKYGVLYAAVVDKRNPDGLCDIVVSAEDAARVNRIADRFALSARLIPTDMRTVFTLRQALRCA